MPKVEWNSRQQKIDRTPEGPMTFRDVATYESAFQDVACIKNQLLELQRIISVCICFI